MMTSMYDRMDVLVGRTRGDKTFWVKIGSAWPAKSGEGWDVALDALPLTDKEGRCGFILRVPREKTADKAVAEKVGLEDFVPF